jgi:hypothetical protein
VGALAEVGFCKIFGVPVRRIAKVNSFKSPDIVGTDLQIRGTDHLNGSLIVRSDDLDSFRFVLMIVNRESHVRCAGFVSGREAKRSEFIRSPNGRERAFFVPQNKLSPLALSSAF